MSLLLVRHAVALRRRDWTRPDHLRPLTPRGYAQAEQLPELLTPYVVERILSSPSVRCLETVQPLAARLALPVEELPQLAEGSGAAFADLLDGLGPNLLVCSHGDVVPDLLDVLAPSGGADRPCAKGSTWVLDDDAPPRYLPPPA